MVVHTFILSINQKINLLSMTSNELKELVKSHFSLVEADATEEIVNEEITEEFTEETEEVAEEVFGEIADENSAFVLKFPGDRLEVGDKVMVVTTEGQEMDAPDGEHKLADGKTIVTEDSIVKSISEEAAGVTEEEMAEEVVEEVAEEVAEEVMEEEAEATIEDIVKEIVSAVEEEMGKMKEKMAEMEAKMEAFESAPAAEPTSVKEPSNSMFSAKKNKLEKFNLETAANADMIKLALSKFKNK
jgi:hypothetical protein